MRRRGNWWVGGLVNGWIGELVDWQMRNRWIGFVWIRYSRLIDDPDGYGELVQLISPKRQINLWT